MYRRRGLEASVLINAGSLIDARGSEARVLINAGGGAFIISFTVCYL